MLPTDFSLFPELVTERLILRKVCYEDAAAVLKLRGDEQVMQYIGKTPAVNMEEATGFVEMILQALTNNEGITWAMTLKEDPANLIGTIGFWRLMKPHFRAEIGYMLRPDWWRQGYMKEALLRVVDIGFQQLNLHSIEANINPDNLASANLLAATGFVKEAHFRENFFYNGVYSDTAVFSKLQPGADK